MRVLRRRRDAAAASCERLARAPLAVEVAPRAPTAQGRGLLVGRAAEDAALHPPAALLGQAPALPALELHRVMVPARGRGTSGGGGEAGQGVAWKSVRGPARAMNAEGGGADTTCSSSPRCAAAQRWSCRGASGSGTVSRPACGLGTAGRLVARAGVVRPGALHAARPSDLSRAAARAAAPREPRPWLAPRALMWDRRRISEGLRACTAGTGGTGGVRALLEPRSRALRDA